MADTRTAALRDALRDFGHGGGPHHRGRPSGFDETACRWVFDRAGITIPTDRFDAVQTMFARTPFYGGNYTLDAQRLLRALATPEEAGRG